MVYRHNIRRRNGWSWSECYAARVRTEDTRVIEPEPEQDSDREEESVVLSPCYACLMPVGNKAPPQMHRIVARTPWQLLTSTPIRSISRHGTSIAYPIAHPSTPKAQHKRPLQTLEKNSQTHSFLTVRIPLSFPQPRKEKEEDTHVRKKPEKEKNPTNPPVTRGGLARISHNSQCLTPIRSSFPVSLGTRKPRGKTPRPKPTKTKATMNVSAHLIHHYQQAISSPLTHIRVFSFSFNHHQ